MKNKGNDFPKYRQMSNRKVYYKIINTNQFVELQFLGKKKLTYQITATKYPEKMRIQSMLKCETPFEKLKSKQIQLLFND